MKHVFEIDGESESNGYIGYEDFLSIMTHVTNDMHCEHIEFEGSLQAIKDMLNGMLACISQLEAERDAEDEQVVAIQTHNNAKISKAN